jgi:hypothetical protein
MTHRIPCSDTEFARPSDTQPEVHFHLPANRPRVLLQHAIAHTLRYRTSGHNEGSLKTPKERRLGVVSHWLDEIHNLICHVHTVHADAETYTVSSIGTRISGGEKRPKRNHKKKFDTFKTVSLSNPDVLSSDFFSN